MAQRVMVACGKPGCAGLVRNSTCSVCGPRKRARDTRPSSGSRGYDAQWQRVRAAQLRRHPLCEDCGERGYVTEASEVHHVVALRLGGMRLDYGNLRSLCKGCHSRRTARGE